MGPHHDLTGVGHARRRLLVGLVAILLTLGAVSPGPAGAEEQLTPVAPDHLDRSDQLGYQWDPNVQGVLRDGTNDCFDAAMSLRVGGSSFTGNETLQTKDGEELVLRGSAGDIAVTRRIRIDLVKGAARYVEVLENKSARSVTTTVEVRTNLGSSAQAVVSDKGRGVLNGPLEKDEVGVVAVQGGGPRPGVLFQLRTPRSNVSPEITVANNRAFTFMWTVEVPAGEAIAFVHTVAQRRWNGPPAGTALEAEFKPFLERTWLAGLPSTVRAAVVNHSGAEGPTALVRREPADESIKALAEAYDVKRGEEAVVFFEKEAPLSGTVFGANVRIVTRLGTAEVPFGEVAVLLGGAAMGRSMRVCLRGGEVLAGEVKAEGLLFASKSGLEIPLEPAGIDALFLPRGTQDGDVANGADALLTQLDGMRLALAAAPDARLHAVTPWGALDVPLDDVVRIDALREPAPGLRMHLRDGSTVPVVLQGGSLKLQSLRFGPLEVEPASVAAWQRTAADAQVERTNTDGAPRRTHVHLAADCHLVGALDGEKLQADTIAGATPLVVAHLEQIERAEDADADGAGLPRFEFTLASGEKLQGRLRERLLAVRTAYGLCRVPVQHLRDYRRLEPPGEDPKADDAGKDDK